MPRVLSIFEEKSFRVCYWDAESRYLASDKILFEKKLEILGDVELVPLKSLDDKAFHPCQLLIIAADSVAEEDFQVWLKSLEKKIAQQGKVWTPTLILSTLSFETLDALLTQAVKSNWYFDILSRDHLDSLPIRVANLLRISDHLLELWRYNDTVSALSKKTAELENKIQSLVSKKA